MFSIKNSLADWQIDRHEELIGMVVERSAPEIDADLDARLQRMSIAEARGYVRARARRSVQKHVLLLAGELGGISATTARHIVSKAMERATYKVVRERLTVPQVRFALRVAG